MIDRLDKLCIDTIRTLSMDAVQQAKSGHPGTPMALAPVVYLLFTRYLKHNPANPSWPDRDRFILSAGHASMLLYSILYLTGYDLSLEEIKRFRQWGSKTPGHPEYGHTPGVEVTTGPLGQGCGNSVGMAIAQAHLAARFNRPGHAIVDHRTYALCSDGDMMEGVSHEAASLAGHLALGNLVWIYDDNRITIEGSTSLAFSEDVLRRFEAYGWHVQVVDDANDLEALAGALDAARQERTRPSFIKVRSHIGYGAPKKQDTAAAHGEPLGEEDIRGAKAFYSWPSAEPFHVPDEALAHCRKALERGSTLEAGWRRTFERWQSAHPDLASEWERAQEQRLPEGWDEGIPVFAPGKAKATRSASGAVLNALAERVPELIGGSADLAGSNKTLIDASGDFLAAAYGDRNLHFGVREHAMGAVANGIALHGGLRPYTGTFLVFADYMRPSLRLAALSRARVIFVFTHDSIGLGEDGPTHQPVEHLMSLRAIPGFTLLRPAEANETAAAWRVALAREGPVALALTRQDVPVLDPASYPIVDGVPLGAYVLVEAEGGPPDVILIATGSEVHLALEGREQLRAQGVRARVVSMPCWELFREQPEYYRAEVLPREVPKVAIEAGVTLGWREYVGDEGEVIGLDRFGGSAPWQVAYRELGLTVERVVERVRALLARAATRP
ncbi:MAG: transketolase [Gemmatimonadetes bacterium]|nr:transketolase [Gemmatimonadota bacterium]